MRCKICLKTYRIPTERMKKTQICFTCRNKSLSYKKIYERQVLEFILENEPANPHEITKKFDKINLAHLERDEKIVWDKNGVGWILTQKTKEDINSF